MSTPALNYSKTNLFKPIKVGSVELKHRVALAPLTRNRLIDEGNINVELAKEYYSQRSKREGTLVITEGVSINEDFVGTLPPAFAGLSLPILNNDNRQADWKEIIEGVHANKSFVFVQLCWVNFTQDVNNYSEADLKRGISDAVAAAQRAFEAGADGIELHMGNGTEFYKIGQPGINNRSDQYGGSIENRSRFALELLEAVGNKFGYERVGIRISPFYRFDEAQPVDKFTTAQAAYFVGKVEELRLQGKEPAYLSVIEARNQYVEGAKDPFTFENVDFVPAIYKGVVIRAGNFIVEPEKLNFVLQSDKTILAFGRYFIANSDLPDRLEKGIALNAYNRNTFYTRGREGYTDYPLSS